MGLRTERGHGEQRLAGLSVNLRRTVDVGLL